MLFNNSAIPVVEDQPFIALDLAPAIEDAGGAVLGPAASVAQALELPRGSRADGAILGVKLAPMPWRRGFPIFWC